jgi:hypothetical protein
MNTCTGTKNFGGSCWLISALHVLYAIDESHTMNYAKIMKKYKINGTNHTFDSLTEITQSYCPYRPNGVLDGGYEHKFLNTCFKELEINHPGLLQTINPFKELSLANTIRQPYFDDNAKYYYIAISDIATEFTDQRKSYYSILSRGKNRLHHVLKQKGYEPEVVLYGVMCVATIDYDHLTAIKRCEDGNYYIFNNDAYPTKIGPSIEHLFVAEGRNADPISPSCKNYGFSGILYKNKNYKKISKIPENFIYSMANKCLDTTEDLVIPKNATIINLHNNNFKSINLRRLFENNTGPIKILSLENCNIKNIFDVDSLPKINQIILCDNAIDEFPHNFAFMDIEMLDVSNNFISNINGYTFATNGYFICDYNHLASLNHLQFVKNIVVSFSNNRIKSISNFILHNHLEVLDLSYNFIPSIDFALPSSLEALYLNNNSLTAIDQAIIKLLKSREKSKPLLIHLSHNNISSVAPLLNIDNHVREITVKIKNNPINVIEKYKTYPIAKIIF